MNNNGADVRPAPRNAARSLGNIENPFSFKIGGRKPSYLSYSMVNSAELRFVMKRKAPEQAAQGHYLDLYVLDRPDKQAGTATGNVNKKLNGVRAA